MSEEPLRGSGPVPVLSALTGAAEATVAAACAGSRAVVLVRRCADVAELVSTAEAGLGQVVLLTSSFHGLDGDVVARLLAAGTLVLGLVDPDRESSERLRAWGVEVVAVPGLVDGTAEHEPLLQAVSAAVARSQALVGAEQDHTAEPSRAEPGADGPRGEHEDIGAEGPRVGEGRHHRVGPPAVQHTGRVTVVWGTAGAPGRTTVAVNLAMSLAEAGAEVLLVDADTYAASVAQVLGMLDESPGLVAACRAGLDGRLDADQLLRLAPSVAPRVRVLTGISRGARWAELRPAGLAAVLRVARTVADHVVVDVAAPLEDDDGLLDVGAPRRNCASVDLVRAADQVLAVGSADPVGLQRLVRGLQELTATAPDAEVLVVANRVRATAVGRGPGTRVREALLRFAGVEQVHLVPDDPSSLDRAVLAGRSLVESSPDSAACTAVRELAARLCAHPLTPTAAPRARARRARTA